VANSSWQKWHRLREEELISREAAVSKAAEQLRSGSCMINAFAVA